MGYEAPKDYVEVSERILEFRAAYPSGSLQGDYQLVSDGKLCGWVYTARAYRTPDDPRPGIGTAWEPIPGKTPYTRDSELQNAETSAWGRALIAVGAADAKRGIASAQEVRSRSYVHTEMEAPAARPHADRQPRQASPTHPATEKQIQLLWVLGKERGYSDKDVFRDFLTDQCGRLIASSKDLTAAEASAVIERLKGDAS